MAAAPTTRLLTDLTAEGLLPPAQAAAIAEDERTRPFSLHYELRALGADTIGHAVLHTHGHYNIGLQ